MPEQNNAYSQVSIHDGFIMNISKIPVILTVLLLYIVSCSTNPVTKNRFGHDISNKTSNSARNVTTQYEEKNERALGENRKISLFGLEPSKYIGRAIAEKLPSQLQKTLSATPREKLQERKDIVKKNKSGRKEKEIGGKAKGEPKEENISDEEEEDISEEEIISKKEKTEIERYSHEEKSTEDEVDSEEEMDDEKGKKPIKPTSPASWLFKILSLGSENQNARVTQKSSSLKIPVISKLIEIVLSLLAETESVLNAVIFVRNIIHSLRA